MAQIFQNQNPLPPFGSYTDPYADRRGTGPRTPAQPLECREPQLLGEFDPEKLYFCWLGHSSVFLHLAGCSLLIDPVFSSFVSPIPFAGPKRFPGRVLTAAELPHIDLVLITHNHYDHLDAPTVRALAKGDAHFIVPTGVGQLVQRCGAEKERIHELGWYEEYRRDGLRIALTPSQHGSARSLSDRNRTLWGGFVLKSDCFTVYDTGDGGFGAHFADIRARYGQPDLAIMECGQYNTRWHPVHMFPEESAEAARILGAKLAIPVHWGAYVLSDHAWDDPPKRFSRRAAELGIPCQVPVLYEMIRQD